MTNSKEYNKQYYISHKSKIIPKHRKWNKLNNKNMIN